MSPAVVAAVHTRFACAFVAAPADTGEPALRLEFAFMKAKPSLGEIAAKAALSGVPYAGGSLNQIIAGLQQRRTYVAEHALGAISDHVGWDAFLSIVEGNPEIEAILWTALQAITMTGVESKRKVLERVVANAMTSDEPIDMEQLKVMALAELDAPHLRALVRLAEADWLDRKASSRRRDSPENGQTYVDMVAKQEPIPVLAALIRTGVVYPGGAVDAGQGLLRMPPARELSIGGVTEFGEELLDDLRAQDDEEVLPEPSERAAHRAFMRELKRAFESKSGE